MEWFAQLDKAFGAAAAVVIGMLVSAIIFVVKQWNGEREAHNRTRDAYAVALQAINEKNTAALLANATNVAQFTELLRQKGPP